VSCASESLCVAVDAAGNVLSSTDPSGGSAAWSVLPVDAGHAFTSVSCTPAATGLCVAVDNTGYAVASTFSPSTEGEGGHGGGGGEQGGGGKSGAGQTGGSTTLTEPSPSILPPAAISNVFSISRVKVEGDGQIVLALEAPAAGLFNALATTEIAKAAAVSARQKTRHKSGRARKITYGTGTATALGAGTMTVTIKPTKSALSALKSSRTLRVPVTIVFHPRSGSPTTVSEAVTVRYQSPRRARACSASNGACRGER
jgi:hypothetical protein